jgi:hypothetical protein
LPAIADGIDKSNPLALFFRSAAEYSALAGGYLELSAN